MSFATEGESQPSCPHSKKLVSAGSTGIWVLRRKYNMKGSEVISRDIVPNMMLPHRGLLCISAGGEAYCYVLRSRSEDVGLFVLTHNSWLCLFADGNPVFKDLCARGSYVLAVDTRGRLYHRAGQNNSSKKRQTCQNLILFVHLFWEHLETW